jgi:sulfotransferase
MIRHGIHFISGLPRSGSTLLAAILRQNPRFHASMSSPLGAIYMAMQGAVSRRTEGAVFIEEDQKQALLQGVFQNYYHGIGETQVVFDTNRMWCSRMDHIAAHFPDAKVICCVRDIGWIMDSLERLVRRNIYDLSGIFGFEPGGTVYTRVTRLAASDGMVGFALDALREAFHGGRHDRLLLVDYEALTRDPAGAMQVIYQFIGEAPFEHDFEHVSFDAEAFDAALGTPGLHRVGPKVGFETRTSILPPELFTRFSGDSFWKDPKRNPAKIPVLMWGQAPRGGRRAGNAQAPLDEASSDPAS